MPRPRSGAQPQPLKSLDKAIRVLEAFTESAPERSDVDLAREVDLPTTTVNRIVRALELHGFLFLLAFRQLPPWARRDPARPPRGGDVRRRSGPETGARACRGGDAGARPAGGSGLRRQACPLRGGHRLAPAPACRGRGRHGRTAHGGRDRKGSSRLPGQRGDRRRAGRAAGSARRGHHARSGRDQPRSRPDTAAWLRVQLAGDLRRRVGGRGAGAGRRGPSIRGDRRSDAHPSPLARCRAHPRGCRPRSGPGRRRGTGGGARP